MGLQYSRVNLSSDPVYHYIHVTKPRAVPGEFAEQDLIDSAWLQRLRRIHQLQSAWWVFATAEHSRFQHSLGAMHLGGTWARHLYPSLARHHPDLPSAALVVETVRVACLLHDIGHGPFGHFFDENFLDRWGLDHEAVGRHLIQFELAPLVEGLGASPEADFAPGERIDWRWVAYLISEAPLSGYQPPSWVEALRPLLVGPYSADNMDYVPRDSYICGVATGPVDVERIVHYSFISDHGLTLHSHGAEALFMFLNARLYLYHQVYFHRTVRRIDLQLREIFRPTIEAILRGSPLEDPSGFRRLTEWSLLAEVDAWGAPDQSAPRRALAERWADIVARRLKWRLVFSGYLEAHEAPNHVLRMSREEFSDRIRQALPERLRTSAFEVDVAAQDSRAFNPLMESSDILLFDPLEGGYQRSRVLDLFRRLPVRIALFRIFALDDAYRKEYSAAARLVLGAR